jgi:hypothetical protein
MQKWWLPWLFPVELLGTVMLVSRPLLCLPWFALCLGGSRLVNGYVIYRRGRTAPGTHPYLRTPS